MLKRSALLNTSQPRNVNQEITLLSEFAPTTFCFIVFAYAIKYCIVGKS